MDETHHPYLVWVNLVQQAVLPDEEFLYVWIVEFGNRAAPFWKLLKGTRDFQNLPKEPCGAGR